ncbi:histidine kinase CKI1 [Gossypium hirsutum]|uniref:histidine kinase n=1 Tax=Gossypium hirsutum TaxID=3635 RepID=A0ABM3BA47_GOSHI|nr:histidine kinase CKI1-like [Gossypium hirsutum]
MNLNISIASRPVIILIFLALLVLISPSIMITWWYKTTRQIEQNVDFNTHSLDSGFQSQIHIIANSIPPLNSSAASLAKLLSSSFNQTDEISFDEIETKVAPTLFLAFTTIPYLSQISYVGLEGLFFSYNIDGNQTLLTYANSSFSSRKKHVWYKQPVDNQTGKLYGEPVISHSFNVVNTSWFQVALNHSWGYSSLENGWNNGGEPLFLTSVSLLGKGVIAMGVPVKNLTDRLGGINLYGGSLSLITMDGKLLLNGIANTKFIYVNGTIFLQFMWPNGVKNFPCSNDTSETYMMDIDGKEYNVRCSTVKISGVQSVCYSNSSFFSVFAVFTSSFINEFRFLGFGLQVYALALPHEGIASFVYSKINYSHIALVVTMVLLVIPLVFFISSMTTNAQREIYLHDKLIKQMEATRKAERKSMNKSLALVGASHDIRAALAGITGYIDLCLANAAPGSDFETYLKQMSLCAQDLLGLLNSILDTSKIEAGMMNLEEQEFNLADLIEHVVDLYHPVGMIKGVDVVLDPCDGSIIKLSQVKGDRGKLKQILSNILSNAVKFTVEGHVCVRAWVRKHDFKPEKLASTRKGLGKYVFRLFSDKNEGNGDVKAESAVRQNRDSVEIVFEVDDTGKGIPKEKQKSVFENYVQVKETAAGQVGTGLGLGIVQSLVHLMGGEIGIVNKEFGEKGTCFRFTVFLRACETQSDAMYGGTNSSFSIRNSSPKLGIRTPSPKLDGSQVVLFMQNIERRRVSQKFLESFGISVLVVDQCHQFPSAMKKIQPKLNSLHHSSRRSDMSCRSDISSSSSKDMPLSAMEGAEHKLPFNRRKDTPSFILLVIDVNAESFSELWRIVAEFRRGLHSTCCKVIWLDKPTSPCINPKRLDPDDEILLQPFHGSRLHRVIKLLPEFRNLSQGISSSSESSKHPYNKTRLRSSQRNDEIQEYVSSSDERYSKQGPSSPTLVHTRRRLKSKRKNEDSAELSNGEMPLFGKRILIAEDNKMLSILAITTATQLGADVEHCENGNEALERVCNGLKAQRNYDYVLMDCEMSPINGYEATRRIRIEEERYGVRIPIIALTAHTSGTEALEAGMDAHLNKPLVANELMKVIESLQTKK